MTDKQSRRSFLGFLGVGTAVAALAGRQLVVNNVVNEMPTDSNHLSTVPAVKSDSPLLLETNSHKIQSSGILRIGHKASSWVQNGQVKAGHFFNHLEGATECEDMGNELIVQHIRCTGVKAMRFGSFEQGVKPIEVATAYDDPVFIDIVSDSLLGPGYGDGCLYGPVYMLSVNYQERFIKNFEFFCGTPSTRAFAAQKLEPVPLGTHILGTREVMYRPRYVPSWFVPTLTRYEYYNQKLLELPQIPADTSYNQGQVDVFARAYGKTV